jgi:hypothetical protein
MSQSVSTIRSARCSTAFATVSSIGPDVLRIRARLSIKDDQEDRPDDAQLPDGVDIELRRPVCSVTRSNTAARTPDAPCRRKFRCPRAWPRSEVNSRFCPYWPSPAEHAKTTSAALPASAARPISRKLHAIDRNSNGRADRSLKPMPYIHRPQDVAWSITPA